MKLENIGKKIKFCRNKLGFTQEDMAEKLNISFQSYSKIERNITDVNLSRLQQIAKILNVSIKDFFEEKSQFDKSKENEYLSLITQKNEEIIRLQKQLIAVISKNSNKKQ